MTGRRFKLVGRVSSYSPKAVKPDLGKSRGEGLGQGSQRRVRGRGQMEGESAKELNRALLSALRRVEKRTRLRAEWTSDDGNTERYFDYVLKKTTKAGTTP